MIKVNLRIIDKTFPFIQFNSNRLAKSQHFFKGKQLNKRRQEIVKQSSNNVSLSTNSLSLSAKRLQYKGGYSISDQQRVDITKDFYQILNVSSTATETQIKVQFYKLAKQFHPDANKGNEQKFKTISEAYQVLGNAQAKYAYDKLRNIKKQTHNNQNSHTEHQPKYYQTQQQKNPYYNHSRAQWAAFRQGYTYTNLNEQYFHNNMYNTISVEQYARKFKKRRQQQQQYQYQYEQRIKQQMIYIQKIRQKYQKDRTQYLQKVKKLEEELYNSKLKIFNQSKIGKIVNKISNSVSFLKSKIFSKK